MTVTLRVAARTDVGRRRHNNEDAFVAADLAVGRLHGGARFGGAFVLGPPGALLAVSDGMGGAQAGEVASTLVVEALPRFLASHDSGTSKADLTTAVQEANREVWDEAGKRGIEMGATLTAIYVKGSAAYVAEVGDSRAYLLRAGRITQLTKDQSFVQSLVDSGVVSPSDAEEHPMRHVILQAMGLKPNVSVALGRLDLRQRDCLLVCSDGLTTMVTEDAIRDVVLQSQDLMSAADGLIDLANDNGGRDNVTALLAGVGGDLSPPAISEGVQRTYRILETFDASVSA